ncbi:Clathrin light chain A-like protein [Dinothrombium tinctorium]|uniref:Clathrin light chain n=1 Tax=Dinothrombium tinctorium TaxID=1965070 RepID=A0A3S3RN20_9ACAR|nr:Clathrin light chain A-like protein [Dinothrombium tinctorium]
MESFEEMDPAAEFIAREQNALQALDDDYNFVNDNHFEALNGEVNDHKTRPLQNGDVDANQLNGPVILGSNANPKDASPISEKEQQHMQKEEPEKIRKWREEHQRLLEAKDKEEAKRKEELREQAKRELEEWYQRYTEQLEKSKLNNRNAEKEWIAERDAEAPGLEWEKIARMCDFNPKAARNTRDTSRMRSILLQLKQNPPAGAIKNSP